MRKLLIATRLVCIAIALLSYEMKMSRKMSLKKHARIVSIDDTKLTQVVSHHGGSSEAMEHSELHSLVEELKPEYWSLERSCRRK